MFDCVLMVRNNVLRETCMCALGWSKQSNDLTSRQPVMYVIWMVILFVRRRKGTKTEEKKFYALHGGFDFCLCAECRLKKLLCPSVRVVRGHVGRPKLADGASSALLARFLF